MTKTGIKFLAYYLPQFHPIPENDEWWGKGFTEWTNVTRARPLFRGHYQPILPADLGFYDLRLTEARVAQAELASEHGIDGFIYYHYWFGENRMLLEKPAEGMLLDKKPDFPFCFCWANETWRGIWHGLEDSKTLMKQEYSGVKGYKKHFQYLLPFFRDSRYIKVDNKPMFHIYRIEDIPDLDIFLQVFEDMAISEGFAGMYFISTIVSNQKLSLHRKEINGQVGVDFFQRMRYNQGNIFAEDNPLFRIELKLKKWMGHTSKLGERSKPLIYDYKKGVANFNNQIPHKKYIPCVFPNWDNSARSGKRSMIFVNSDPEGWQEHLQKTVDELLNHPQNPPFIIIKSWNEWAEGNHLEPDKKYGLGWLQAVKNVKENLTGSIS
ncbi:glycosyltransferase WbsX family protein [Salinimicrobium sp. TH3]|uniref:glycosyltransferase WbsX family protein n=1 Tax=Salinimicrobium sp. TH3 TaxID=2997342 RepID=UPI002273A531|nr:glycoside hydrolase family 99-like domain-containing protein [Salinimicrobium sp. TH3]MCY2687854.1 glycoside hydrolase family 99-like domain-containing protein [Salinimicrobium sp. TH3]